jgi:hypothetical protein
VHKTPCRYGIDLPLDGSPDHLVVNITILGKINAEIHGFSIRPAGVFRLIDASHLNYLYHLAINMVAFKIPYQCISCHIAWVESLWVLMLPVILLYVGVDAFLLINMLFSSLFLQKPHLI